MFVFITAMNTIINSTLASSLPSNALPSMMAEWGNQDTVLPISMFLIGEFAYINTVHVLESQSMLIAHQVMFLVRKPRPLVLLKFTVETASRDRALHTYLPKVVRSSQESKNLTQGSRSYPVGTTKRTVWPPMDHARNFLRLLPLDARLRPRAELACFPRVSPLCRHLCQLAHRGRHRHRGGSLRHSAAPRPRDGDFHGGMPKRFPPSV